VSEYQLKYTEKAKEHIKIHKLSGNKTIYKKINKLLKELKDHPKEGTGKPEYLKYEKYWSRRINKEHRLCYVMKFMMMLWLF
jgi:toxin YoeB